jgi:hypothetical protein
MLELGLRLRKLGTQGVNHVWGSSARAAAYLSLPVGRVRAGAPRGEPAARCSTADRQVLINPCGLKTNFFATPLSKSL